MRDIQSDALYIVFPKLVLSLPSFEMATDDVLYDVVYHSDVLSNLIVNFSLLRIL